MAMEVTTLPLPLDFNFDSNCSSPYITAPSSPQRFPTLFLTAPPSTSRNNTDQDNFHFLDYDDHDFQFDFSGHLDTPSLSAADELFHGGKILPLKPPTARSRTTTEPNNKQEQDQDQEQERRGRERNISNSSKPPNYVHKGSRSLSPFRVSDLILDDQEDQEDDTINTETTTSTTTTTTTQKRSSSFFSAISFSSKGYKKWKLKDLLLFRSASEGRAIIAKDQYTVLSKRSSDVVAEDVKNSSFRSTDSSTSGVGSSSRRIGGRVSAHELHYTANRAVAEEMKRKTNLPYKHGLLGCLGGFNNHDISKSIGSLTRG